MKLLLIEDDQKTSSFVARNLEQSGHTVDCALDGEKGIELGSQATYDVIIIDRMLPKRSGLEVTSELRSQNIETPILMLTALASVEERVEGLDAGADDYLGKPFAYTELLARVRALNRRNSAIDSSDLIKIADLEVDIRRRRVSRAGKRIDLTPQEYKLLEFLIQRIGETVTRAMLLERLWGYDFDPRTNIVDAHVSRLRSKIDKGFNQSLIRTLRGIGYVLDEPA